MYQLFSKFPVVNYNNAYATNIVTRIKFTDLAKKRSAVFFPYTIKEGERPDQIANFYYGDSRYAWIVLLSNDITDPYYDWPMSEEIFKDFIIEKYGSVEDAFRKILYWRVNWGSDDRQITPSQYNSLVPIRKRYWTPNIGYNEQIVSYRRKEIQMVRETNRIVEVVVDNTQGLEIDHVIKQSNTTAQIAQGTIKYINTETKMLTVQHISGEFANTSGANGSIFVANNTSTTANVTSTTLVATPIPDILAQYWQPVSAYMFEHDSNETKKHIRLVDKTFINQIEKELALIL